MFFRRKKNLILLIFFLYVLYDIVIHLAKGNFFCLTGDEFKKSKISTLFTYFLRVFTINSIFIPVNFIKKNEINDKKEKNFSFFWFESDFEKILSPGRNFH
jgi:hypothetical protein